MSIWRISISKCRSENSYSIMEILSNNLPNFFNKLSLNLIKDLAGFELSIVLDKILYQWWYTIKITLMV